MITTKMKLGARRPDRRRNRIGSGSRISFSAASAGRSSVRTTIVIMKIRAMIAPGMTAPA
jgi:hypothetical protein